MDGKPRNEKLKPGERAWRPPNGISAGLSEAKVWKARDGAARQQILNGPTLEVDNTGEIAIKADGDGRAITVDLARERGWGEIHSDSYGELLSTLHIYLNSTFRAVYNRCDVADHWTHVNLFDRAKWGTTRNGVAAPLTDEELARFAEYHYPVYACGYNWLESNEISAKRLEERIENIIGFWGKAGCKCDQVILVTHSMGGLVARACAKRTPSMIKGIIHGVLPALGAPACYRRIACGTESFSPSNGTIENKKAEAISEIAGASAAETTPVMAVAAGPLELLPNHLFPKPWLFASVRNGEGSWTDLLGLPEGNPYELYRDVNSWYRLFDLSLADPINRYGGAIGQRVATTIRIAEKFHTEILGDYYHPNTFAFYCDDPAFLSYGSCRWLSISSSSNLRNSDFRKARFLEQGLTGVRTIEFADGRTAALKIGLQDAAGDGTVPAASGSGPEAKVKYLFRVRGFDHQGSYNAESMLKLTLHLIVRLVTA
ncbi:esterase/lipase family protein [Pseudoduganella violaceinigra]|uniref:esterase/lipase family protein n=1 Tax=Pseudoduganella violaceinigra TaxID=246602 RepID=UPI001B7FB023|nr:alpha/beta hydrolase [Pseudoduganella violaceinigra]